MNRYLPSRPFNPSKNESHNAKLDSSIDQLKAAKTHLEDVKKETEAALSKRN